MSTNLNVQHDAHVIAFAIYELERLGIVLNIRWHLTHE